MSKKSILEKLDTKEKEILKKLKQEVENNGLIEDLLDKIPSPRIAAALLEIVCSDRIGDPQLISFIKGVKERFSDNKDVKKSIKRIAYKLNKKGIDTKEIEIKDKDDFIPIYLEKKESKVYIGPIIGMLWKRPILFELYLHNTGIDIGFALISDISGIENFIFGNFSKKRFNILKNEIEKGLIPGNWKLINTNLSHGRTLFEEAYNKGIEGERPEGIEELRKWLMDNVKPLERHPVYDLISDAEVSQLGNLKERDLDKLFSHELMEGWYVTDEEIDSVSEEIKKIEESPLVLSEYQIQERIRQIKDKYRSKIFPNNVFRRRFEEMAYYFFVIGEKEMSILCLKAAISFKEKSSSYKLITDYMLDRVISNEKEENGKSPIITLDQL